MRWHREGRINDGLLRHLADSLAWQKFDEIYPWFASDPRNVRLGLATDGFNPFGAFNFNAPRLWPVLYGADTDSSSGEDADESRILPSYIIPSEDSEELGQSSLMIERVPENHYKDLTPREVNQVQELKVFVVPPKEETTDVGVFRHDPIIFYRVSDGRNSSSLMNGDEWPMEDSTLHHIMRVPLPPRRSDGLIKILEAMSPMFTTGFRAEQFEKVLTHRDTKIIGPDGKPKNTRGLGYEEPNVGFDDNKFTPVQYSSDSDSDSGSPTCDLNKAQRKADYANNEIALRSGRGRGRGMGRGRGAFTNLPPRHSKPNRSPNNPPKVREIPSMQGLFGQMENLNIRSGRNQSKPSNDRKQARASCLTIETEACQPSYAMCKVCNIAGECEEMVSCPKCGILCHPPCTKFEEAPRKHGECARWRCLRCVKGKQAIEPETTQEESKGVPPSEIGTSFPLEGMLAELLQEYLNFQARHGRVSKGLENTAPNSQKLTPAVSQEKNTLAELKNKTYSFGRDKVAKAFNMMVQSGLSLPACKRPMEAGMTNDHNYCPYHRILGHTIEDCWVFKDLLERKSNDMTLPATVLSCLGKAHAPLSGKDKRRQKARSASRPKTPSQFEEGDMVSMLGHSKSSINGQITAEWRGPYIVEQALGQDTYKLRDSNGGKFAPPIKGKYLQEYQAPRTHSQAPAPIIYGMGEIPQKAQWKKMKRNAMQ